MNVKKDILWRVYFAFLLIAILAGTILVQMGKLQTVKRASLTKLSDSMSTKWDSIYPMRGNIYSADGSLLATSIPKYDVHMDTQAGGLTDDILKDNLDSLAWYMANYFKGQFTQAGFKNDFLQARKDNDRYFLIKRNLTHDSLAVMRTFPIFRLGRYSGGLRLAEKSKRFMPFETLGFRTIGFTRDGINAGLEGGYDSVLRGVKGRRLMQKVSGGMVPVNEENEVDPKDGMDLITTLDINYQDITENALSKGLIQNKAAHGCAIVMEVATGKVLAVANLTQEGDKYVEEYNYAIGEAIEPGSTFKLASVMALLDKQKCTPDTKVATGNGLQIYCNQEMHDSKEGGHGTITMREAFEVSSNIGISKLVRDAFSENPAEFTDYLYGLHLQKKLGVSIPGEGAPYVKNPHSKSWSCTSLPWMSIGYELQVTPLQILTLYNSVANNGVMVKPLFVTSINDVGKPVRQFGTTVLNPQVCTPKTLATVKEFMEGVVESGTAKNINNDLYKIAGKTGTAQIANTNKGYGEKGQKIYQSSFVGYFPANKPAYSIIVVVSSPSNGVYYGSAVSAPVFKEISDKIYARTATMHNYSAAFENKMDATLPLVSSTNQEYLSSLMAIYGTSSHLQVSPDKSTWVKAKAANDKINLAEYKTPEKKVPDVTGMALSDAVYILENVGLKARFSGAGKVSAQSLTPGSFAGQGQIIELKLD